MSWTKLKLSALVCHGISFKEKDGTVTVPMIQGVPVLKQVLVDKQSTHGLTHKCAQMGEWTVECWQTAPVGGCCGASANSHVLLGSVSSVQASIHGQLPTRGQCLRNQDKAL